MISAFAQLSSEPWMSSSFPIDTSHTITSHHVVELQTAPSTLTPLKGIKCVLLRLLPCSPEQLWTPREYQQLQRTVCKPSHRIDRFRSIGAPGDNTLFRLQHPARAFEQPVARQARHLHSSVAGIVMAPKLRMACLRFEVLPHPSALDSNTSIPPTTTSATPKKVLRSGGILKASITA